MVNKLLIFLIIILSANGFLYAQNSVVYQNIISEEGTVKYSAQVDNGQQEKNFIIQQLALSIPKKAEFTEYSYTFSVILRVQKAGDFKFNATVETDNYKCFGDIHYKGFDISDVLIPSKLDLFLSVFSGNLPKLDNKHIANAPMNFGYNKIYTAQFTDSTVNPTFSINISNKKVIYDTVSTGNFIRKRKLIDDYYLSELQMADATTLLGKIDYKDVDMAIVYDIRLMDVEKIVNQLFQKDFPARLFLANYDPINYIDKFNKLSTETIKARNELNKNLSILDKLLYEKGLDFLKKNDIKNAVLYFNKTIDYNKYYAPAHYQLARMLFRKDSIYHSSEIIMDIFTNMNPDPETYKNLILLSDSLMKSFMVNGAYYLKTEKYNEAVECYEILIKFCSSTSGLKCADESYKSLSLARFGIFKSYLDVSKRAIDGNRLNLAEVYVLEAKAFQKKYSRDIINDEEADVMMARLAKAYIALGDSSLIRKKYEKALDYYGKAILLCDSNDNFKCPEDINYKISRSKNGLFEEMVKLAYIQYKNKNINRAEVLMAEADEFKKTNLKDITRNAGYDSVMFKIKYLRYHEIVKESRYLSVFASYSEMIGRMKLAKQLEKTFRIPSSKLMDSLIDIYAKPFILKSIKNIYPLVNAGKTDSAKVLAAIQENNIKELLLAGDTSLTNKVNDLKYYIIHIECTSSMSYFNEAFQRAIELANTNDFIYSAVYADSALNIAKKHIDCAIDTSDVYSLKERHKKPVLYQKLLVLANNNYFRSRFDSSLYYYLKAEKYFNAERILNSGLKHIPVEIFILNKNNEKLTIFGIDYLADSIYCDKSLYLLKTLEKNSYSNLLLKLEQQKLGRNTAIEDKKVQPGNKARHNFKTRIGKDKWFKYYKKAYYKAWYNNRFYYVFFTIF